MGRSGAVGTPGATAHLASAALGGPRPAPVGVPEWVSCPCAELCSDPCRVSWAAASPCASWGFSALSRCPQPAARRTRMRAVSGSWPSSGVSSGRNICLPALQRSPPTSQRPFPPAGPRMGADREKSTATRGTVCLEWLLFTLQLLLLAGQPGRLGRGHLDAGPLKRSASAAGLGHLPGHSLHLVVAAPRHQTQFWGCCATFKEQRNLLHVYRILFPLLTLLRSSRSLCLLSG